MNCINDEARRCKAGRFTTCFTCAHGVRGSDPWGSAKRGTLEETTN
jgi:hypothetical protein